MAILDYGHTVNDTPSPSRGGLGRDGLPLEGGERKKISREGRGVKLALMPLEGEGGMSEII